MPQSSKPAAAASSTAPTLEFYKNLVRQYDPKQESLKYKRIIPLTLPLRKKEAQSPQPDSKENTWTISQGFLFIERHFIPAPGQRVTDSAYLKQAEPIDGQVIKKPIQTLICEPLQSDSILSRLILGLHEGGKISIMAMPKIGLGYQLIQNLSNLEKLSDPHELHQPDNPNGHVYQFAFTAGFDQRPRAAMMVCCDNEQDIYRIACFLEGIRQICPFDQSMRDLEDLLLTHAKKQIEGCKKMKELIVKESMIYGNSELSYFSEPEFIRNQRDEITKQKKALTEEFGWQKIDVPKYKGRLFSSYPNLIPDNSHETYLKRYSPESILDYPRQLPDIFQWILCRQTDRLEIALKENPMEMFSLDFRGKLPIELAIYRLADVTIGELIIWHWLALPKEKQFCANIFYGAMNRLVRIKEINPFSAPDNQTRRKWVVNYLRHWRRKDLLTDELNKLLQDHDDEQLFYWKSLIQAAERESITEVVEILCSSISDSQAIFKAFLMDDWELMQAALFDEFPDDAGLWFAVLHADEEKVNFYATEPGIRDDEKMQDILKALKPWYPLSEKIKELEKAIENLKQTTPSDQVRQEYHRLIDQLNQCTEEKTRLLSDFRNYEPEAYPDLEKMLDYMPDHYKYLKELKTKCRKSMFSAEKSRHKETVFELIANEFQFYQRLHHSIKTQNPDDLASMKRLLRDCQQQWRRIHANPLMELQLEDIFDVNGHMPESFELLYAAWQKNWPEIKALAVQGLLAQEQKIVQQNICSEEQANLQKRPAIHRQIMDGIIPDFEALQSELKNFNRLKEALEMLAQNHADALFEWSKKLDELPDDLELAVKYPDYERLIKFGMKRCITWKVYNITIEQSCIAELKIEMDDFLSYLEEANRLKPESNNPVSLLQDYHGQILQLHQAFVVKLQQTIAAHRRLFHCDDLEFGIHITALAWQTLALAFKKVKQDYNPPQQMKSVLRQIRSLPEMRKPAYYSLSRLDGSEHEAIISLIRSALLSFEAQDCWGVTPLVLAIASNRLKTVIGFFKSGLVCERYFHRYEYCHYFTLLPYARTEQMLEAILHFYVKPERQGLFNQAGRNINMLYRQLAYRYPRDIDEAGLTFHDHLLLSNSKTDAKIFEEILPFLQKEIPPAPYDPDISEEKRALLEKTFNSKLSNKEKYSNYPKVVKITASIYEHADSSIILQRSRDHATAVHFFKTSALTTDITEKLPEVFADCFGMKPTVLNMNIINELIQKALDPAKGYHVAIIQDLQDLEINGFLFYKKKKLLDLSQKPINLYYGGIAASRGSARNQGAMAFTFISALREKKQADREQVDLYFYGRFNRPGVSYQLIPEEAKVSVKYDYPQELIKKIAGACDNEITERGTSKSPVVTKVSVVRNKSIQLKEYDHLMERLGAEADEDLPLIFKIDDDCFRAWMAELKEKYDLTDEMLNEFDQQLMEIENNITHHRL